MKLQISSLLSGLALSASLLSPVASMAQGTWDFGGSSCNPGGAPATATCAVGAVTATISAWGFTTAGTGFAQGNLGEFDPNGFGAYTGRYETGAGGSQHGFDNLTANCGITIVAGNSGLSTANSGCGGNVEAMLLNFGSAKVNLSQVKIGFYDTDADLSVYRWDGAAGGPTLTTTVATLGTSALSGWTLVSSNDSDIVNPFNVGGSQYSSYFLISTYFGASSGNLDSGNDAFKILNVTAGTCTGTLTGGSGGNGGNGATCTPNSGGQTPEPASLALVGVALLGATAARRRIKRG